MSGWMFDVVMPVILAIEALFLLGLGLRGLISRKPFLLSARWMFAFVLLSMAPSMLMPLTFSRTWEASGSDLVMTWVGPTMFLVLVAWFSMIMRGYVAFGITDESLRQGLFASLGELKLPHEETLGAIRLPTVPAELQVVVQSWIGTGQIKARKREAAPLVTSIVRGMNTHFRDTKVPINLTSSVVQVVLAILVGVMDIALFVGR